MAELSAQSGAYVAAGRFWEPQPELSERIRALLLTAAADDQVGPFLEKGHTAPSVAELCATLEPIETEEAAPFLAQIAAVDPSWTDHRYMPLEAAEQIAHRIVSVLSSEATWWTNHNTVDGSRSAFFLPLRDSLLAGTDGEHYVVVLRVSDA